MSRRIRAAAVGVALGVVVGGTADARGTYQTPEAFLAEVFPGDAPPAARLWIDAELKAAARDILDHDLGQLRVRYWARAGRSAWILDEIGKEAPITTGIVVAHGKLDLIRVLIYRESRGGEVRYPWFTDQFRGAALGDGMRLDRPIDGIVGATLSVQALTKLARLALLLDRRIRSAGAASMMAADEDP